MPYTEEDWQRIIWRLCSLSGDAREKLPTERWRYTLSNDTENSQEIAYELNRTVLNSLEDIGIYLKEDPANIFLEDHTLGWWVELLEYIVPSGLFQHLRDDKFTKDCLVNLISGSVTDGDILIAYLEWLSLYKPELKTAIDHFYPSLKSDQTFIDFIAGQVELIKEEKLTHDRIEPYYLLLIDNFINRLKDALVVMPKYLDHPELVDDTSDFKEANLPEIYKLCSSTEFASQLGWWLSVKQRSLPENQRNFYLKVGKRIHATIPFTMIYRKERDLPIGPKEEMLGLCFNYATGKYALKAPESSDDKIYKDIDFKGFINELKGIKNESK